MVNREDLVFDTNKYIHNFQQFEMIRSFAKNIFGGKFTLKNADADQNNLFFEIVEFKKNAKPRTQGEKRYF